MNERKTYAADFETSVYPGQTSTEVWAAACVELGTEEVKVFTTIEEQAFYFFNQPNDLIVYYHNLKFDGSFWLNFLLRSEFKPAYTFNENGEITGFVEKKEMPVDSFRYLISSMGQWYGITIKTRNNLIEIRDSVKLMPFSLKKIGKDFETKHQKLEMEYEGERHAGGEIKENELEYIKNDVLVLSEALVKLFTFGINSITIGSACLKDYKSIVNWGLFNYQFPDLRQIEHETDKNLDLFIRKAYHGGWCYVNPKKQKKLIRGGCTYDVNSLYPSVMHSDSGNLYPYGFPIRHWHGNYVPRKRKNEFMYIRFKCRFELKENKLPFIQIKNQLIYNPNEMQITSDIIDQFGNRHRYPNIQGIEYDTTQILTMTETDFILFTENYNVFDFEVIEGYIFKAKIGMFDEYINKWAEIKKNAKSPTERTCAKLMLNNLYGRLSTSDNSSFKICHLDENGTIRFSVIEEHDKQIGYIPVGAAITSYARNFTIRAAQANLSAFCYADTDSIHLNCKPEEAKELVIHDVNFNAWKLESVWGTGYFMRQKTYIEYIKEPKNNGKRWYNVKCAGMPTECQKQFQQELERGTKKMKDLRVGLKIPNALKARQIPGGVVLIPSIWELREQVDVRRYFTT